MKQLAAIPALIWFAVAGAISALTGCAPLLHDPKETYVLVTGDTKLPYWQAILSGLNHAASELKVKAEITGPETYDPNAVYDAQLTSFAHSGGLFSQEASPGFIELWTLQSRMAWRVRQRDGG